MYKDKEGFGPCKPCPPLDQDGLTELQINMDFLEKGQADYTNICEKVTDKRIIDESDTFQIDANKKEFDNEEECRKSRCSI